MTRFPSLLLVLIAVSISVSSGCTSVPDPDYLPIVPRPVTVELKAGAYQFSGDSGFWVQDAELLPTAELFSGEFSTPTGWAFDVSDEKGDIELALNSELGPEAYTLDVDANGVRIMGGDAAGAFYGLQSLRQMLPPHIDAPVLAEGVEWSVPFSHINDAPRFSYRGLHLDVGRNFFDVDFVKSYIDTMARYKFNRFHWHLTEDQGWRIEIDSYPLLTEVGAWRKETVVEKNLDPYIGDGIPHGGFYTKDQVRDVIAYAAQRHVMIIPEIEMPGHAGAALAAYPELGCLPGPYEVKTTWGIQSDIFCPSETTFSFLTTVLDEVAELFPGPYIHIGGDEVPKEQWEQSPVAQEVIRREGLADEHELQSWFIRRIEKHLNSRNKNLIGWDEILEGGLAPNATVMSWRGTEGGIAAAREGNNVIMTPTNYSYFDFYQGDPETEPLAMNWAKRIITLDTVYTFEPIPDVLTADEQKYIIGAQANLWTEYISTPEYVEYMVWPRATALSEVVWSPKSHRDIDDFYLRLGGNLPHLEHLGINYRIPERLDPLYDQELLDETM